MNDAQTAKSAVKVRDGKEAVWDRIARDPAFQRLLARKARFIVSATVFFMLYYFALPALVGYAPGLMRTPILGPLNLAYLFALSQFVVVWLLAWIYVRQAARFDKEASDVLAKAAAHKEQA